MYRCFISLVFLGMSTSLTVTGVSRAQTLTESGDGAAAPGSVDCTEVSVDYQEDPTLTREERIAMMDRALSRSLNRYDACQTARNGSTGGGGGAGGGGGSGGAAGGGSGSGTGTVGREGSVASQDIAGTEKPSTTESSGTGTQSAARSPADGEVPSTTEGPAGTERETVRSLDNGKIPEDIPPADNDSVLEAQIRRAATNETDPEVKKRLWNEYRKYKGLPSVN